MSIFLADLSLSLFAAAFGVALLAGLVKGVVGFGMPMIMISGLSSFIAPELALAGLIVPTLVTNGWQALRQGARAAWASVKSFRVFLGVGAVMLLASAQLVALVEASLLLLLIGLVVSTFMVLGLIGWRPHLPRRSTRIEAGVGAFAGMIGGLSGIWGPPTILYLTALDVAKRDSIRIQGVIYGLGAVLLSLSHLGSGILNARTIPFSLVLVLPAALGLWLGFQVQDRIDQRLFRRATQVVLLVAGLNLIRRGLMG